MLGGLDLMETGAFWVVGWAQLGDNSLYRWRFCLTAATLVEVSEFALGSAFLLFTVEGWEATTWANDLTGETLADGVPCTVGLGRGPKRPSKSMHVVMVFVRVCWGGG